MSRYDWTPFLGDGETDDWKPEHYGDKVIGKIVSIRTDTKYETPRPVLIIDADEHTQPVRVWGTSVGLQRALAGAAPQVGDRIGIKYTGEEDVGQPSKMKIFQIKIFERAQPAPASAEGDPF